MLKLIGLREAVNLYNDAHRRGNYPVIYYNAKTGKIWTYEAVSCNDYLVFSDESEVYAVNGIISRSRATQAEFKEFFKARGEAFKCGMEAVAEAIYYWRLER